MGWFGKAAAAAGALALGGCTTLYSPPRLQQTVGEDTVSYSLAYSRAANNQILLNILQARDRLPRHYLTVSGIADAPTTSVGGTLTLGPLGLGNPALPFGGSSAQTTTSQSIRPSYGVTPLSPDRQLKAIYAPMPAQVFQYYWENNWPHDLLLQLFAGDVQVGTCPNLQPGAILRAGKVNVAGATPASGECVFTAEAPAKDALPALVERTNGPAEGRPRLIGFNKGGCSVVARASTPAEQLELLKLAAGNASYVYKEDIGGARIESCGSVKGIALVTTDGGGRERIHLLDLRSIEQMTYWLGGRVREGGMPLVRPPGGGDDAPRVPLFQVLQGPPPQGLGDEDFAAALTYRGQRYRAGMAVDCEVGTCGPQKAPYADRSGTVLALLAQLYALAPAPESLSPPTRLIVN